MKRKIEVTTPQIKIVATINTGNGLTRDEVERARDELADDLMRAVANVRWIGAPLNRVRVK